LRDRFRTAALAAAGTDAAALAGGDRLAGGDPGASVDAEQAYRQAAISALRGRAEFGQRPEFQRRGNSMVPIPPGVADIDDYPPGGK
jgi:hypothetical protein